MAKQNFELHDMILEILIGAEERLSISDIHKEICALGRTDITRKMVEKMLDIIEREFGLVIDELDEDGEKHGIIKYGVSGREKNVRRALLLTKGENELCRKILAVSEKNNCTELGKEVNALICAIKTLYKNEED